MEEGLSSVMTQFMVLVSSCELKMNFANWRCGWRMFLSSVMTQSMVWVSSCELMMNCVNWDVDKWEIEGAILIYSSRMTQFIDYVFT